MIPARITFAPQARAQARELARWWRAHRPEAPTLFGRELREALAMIAEAPGAGVPWAHPTVRGVRRVLLAASRHHVYYVHDPSTNAVEVLALWGAVRGARPRFRP